MGKKTTIRISEDIIRITTEGRADKDFSDEYGEYSGGRFDARNYAQSLQDENKEYQIFKGVMTTELTETQII